jgi:Helix-turn-helix domain
MVNLADNTAPLAVSIPEAARLVGVSANTIRNLHYAGKLKTAYIGRRLVVPIQVLEELLRVRGTLANL